MKKLILVTLLCLFTGCNEEQNQKQIKQINKYSDLRIATIKVITAKEIKEFMAFGDLIIEDSENDFLGFVSCRTLEDGKQAPQWLQYRNFSYSINTTDIMFTRDEKVKEVEMTLYYRCKGIFQINEDVYRQELNENKKNKK